MKGGGRLKNRLLSDFCVPGNAPLDYQEIGGDIAMNHCPFPNQQRVPVYGAASQDPVKPEFPLEEDGPRDFNVRTNLR